jgi:segregation and condensation protein A
MNPSQENMEPDLLEQNQESYQISLEIFQGPLDLLLFLIRKKKIDIHDIPIAVITREYLEYLGKKEQINLEHEAEFLLMASFLIYIKSQMLLPREAALEEGEDPREILVARLLDYQNIRAACTILREREEAQSKKWQRTFLPPLIPADDLEFIEVSLFDLAEVFFDLMKRKERESVTVIQGKEYSVEEKSDEILEYLKQFKYLDFQDYFNRQKSIEEALLAFFCLLNMAKNRTIIVIQKNLFNPIQVWLREELSR